MTHAAQVVVGGTLPTMDLEAVVCTIDDPSACFGNTLGAIVLRSTITNFAARCKVGTGTHPAC
jgi:hypothetical protein